MRPVADEWLLGWTPDEKMRKKIPAGDFALVAGHFYPDAEWEEYKILAYYLGWLAVWDDEIDCGQLTHDRPGIEAYIRETNEMIDRLLELSSPDNTPSSSNPILQALEQHIAPVMRAGCSTAAWKRTLESYRMFCEGVAKMHGTLPTVEEYCARRRASVACETSVAQLEYAYGMNLPDELFQHEATKEVLDLACDLTAFVNDIASFRKEIADGQLDNLVFLHRERGITLQEACEEAGKMVCVARERFDQAASRVPRTGDAEVDAQTERFIEGCKEIVTGILSWSFECKRYFGSQAAQIRKDLCVDIVLPAELFNRS